MTPDSGLALAAGLTLQESPTSKYAYVLKRRIGSGGFGEVWESERFAHRRRRGSVALKLLRQTALPEDVERFQNEAHYAAHLPSHAPCVVRCIDDGELTLDTGPLHFAAFEYLPSIRELDLRELARDSGALHAVEVFAAVCDAVAEIHAQGVVHRDLNPNNVLLTPGDRVRIIDFGLAAPLDRPETTQRLRDLAGVTRRAGKSSLGIRYPGFGPREAFWSLRPDDERYDVFQLGVHLYMLLAGCAPYAEPDHHIEPPHNQEETLRSRLQHDTFVDTVADLPERLFDRLADLATACVRTLPADRPAGAAWVGQAVRDIVAGAPSGPTAGGASVAGLRIRVLISEEVRFVLEHQVAGSQPGSGHELAAMFERLDSGELSASSIELSVLEDFVSQGGELLLCWEGAPPYQVTDPAGVRLYEDDLYSDAAVELAPVSGGAVPRLATPAQRLVGALDALGVPSRAVGAEPLATWADLVEADGEAVLDMLSPEQLREVARVLGAETVGTPRALKVAVARRCLDVRRLAGLVRHGLPAERLEELAGDLGVGPDGEEDLSARLARVGGQLFGRRGLCARDLRCMAERWGLGTGGPRGQLVVRLAFATPSRAP